MCIFFNPGLLVIYGFAFVLAIVLLIITIFTFICDQDIEYLLRTIPLTIIIYLMYLMLHTGGVF